MEIGECMIIIKDITIALAAVVTAYVAFTGLNKWQKELKGKVHFDAAKDLIRAVYKFRDEMSYTRNPFITASEFPEDYDPWKKEPKKEADAHVFIYQNRMKPLIEAAKELDVYTLEAEALWGKGIKNKCIKLRRTFFTLQRSVQTHISDISSGRENLRTEVEFKKEVQSHIYESTKKDDELSKEINNAIEKIEEIVRPYLDKNL